MTENGADCEFLSYEPNADQCSVPVEVIDEQQSTKKFKKGHRRAWSMPNSHHRDKALLVVAENNVRQEGPNKRHIVRYRLHPYTSNTESDALITHFIESTKVIDPDEDEIDVCSVTLMSHDILTFRLLMMKMKLQT